MREKRPEILSPAGSMESLRAAVSAGCDAVYIGGSRYGARAYADNPQGDEMLDAIRYCHRYGVKIYMTVNTLLKQRELEEELYEYILPYYMEGLDAVIVQDVGVIRFLHRHFPEMPIHASTQMTLTMGAGVSLLEGYGVTRLVPARELDLQELRHMRRDTELEIEVFVHGALCYCYSGRCLFSSMLGGRSGNRGRCAQPCRMAYRVVGEQAAGKAGICQEGEYLLSPKENCALDAIPALIETGIDSFKIEGRMKRPEYTAFTTAMYRKYSELYIDMGAEDYQRYLQLNQREWQEDLRRLGELYNRDGFTSGYLAGKSGVPGKGYLQKKDHDMMSLKRPKHGGILVGKVLSVGGGRAVYQAEKELHAHDVVEFRDGASQTEYEYTLGENYKKGDRVSTRYQRGCRISPGDFVYRTRDVRLLGEIREKYLEREAKLSVSMQWSAEEAQPARLRVFLPRPDQDGGDITICVEGQACQRAQRQPADPEQIRRLLCQTGETPFVARDCKVELKGELFLPVGEVKRLRREALQKLQERLERQEWVRQMPSCGTVTENEEAVAGAGKQSESGGQREKALWSDEAGRRLDGERIVSVLTAEQAGRALELPAVHHIYLKMDVMTEQELQRLILQGREAGKRMYLALPAIFRKPVYEREREKVIAGNSLFQMEQLTGFVVQNMESFVFLRDETGVSPERIIPDASLYIWNREAAAFWREQGVRHMTLPLELTGEELVGLAECGDMQMIVYGHIPLMVSAQCLRRQRFGCGRASTVHSPGSRSVPIGAEDRAGRFQTLQDARGRRFLVQNMCKYCYNVIWQEKPLVLTGEENRLREKGICGLRYDFTIETPDEMERILAGDVPEGSEGHFRHGVD